MDWETKRKALSGIPMDGWWDRSESILNRCIQKGLTTDSWSSEDWCGDRTALRKTLVQKYLDLYSYVPTERRAVITGGFPGSGKTWILHSRGYNQAFAIVDADMMKAEIIAAGRAPDVEKLTPLEVGVLCHVESTAIAKALFFALVGQGKNVVWDFTMSNAEAVSGRLQSLVRENYRTKSLFVDTPYDVAVKRVKERHQQGVEAFLAGEGMGGRFVPLGVINPGAPRSVFTGTMRMFEQYEVITNAVDREGSECQVGSTYEIS